MIYTCAEAIFIDVLYIDVTRMRCIHMHRGILYLCAACACHWNVYVYDEYMNKYTSWRGGGIYKMSKAEMEAGT